MVASCQKYNPYGVLIINIDKVKHCELAPHLPGLRGRSEARMDSIEPAHRHHARVDLVVQLQGEYGDQHGVQVSVTCPERETSTRTHPYVVIYCHQARRRAAFSLR